MNEYQHYVDWRERLKDRAVTAAIYLGAVSSFLGACALIYVLVQP